jgi:hypothetical protein
LNVEREENQEMSSGIVATLLKWKFVLDSLRRELAEVAVENWKKSFKLLLTKNQTF